MGRLENKVAIVTGAGQGIGRGISIAFAKEGAKIVVSDKNETTAAGTADEIKEMGLKAISIKCDVSIRSEVEKTVKFAIDSYNGLDILVNNAGAGWDLMSFEDTTEAHMRQTLEINLMGTFYFMQVCFPYLKKKGGKIINMASPAGTEGMPNCCAYAAAKEGVRALTRVTAKEWGRYGINVNVICPFAQTPALDMVYKANPGLVKMQAAMIPLGRIGDSEKDIGGVALFLATEDSAFITGHTLMADGGAYILR
jgi:NAD(P)-dependent dehydrogenase (short-subunit alcohol dehydrogenase family)